MEALWKSSAFTTADLNTFKYKEDSVPDHPSSTRIYVKSSLLSQGQPNWLAKTKGRLDNEWNLWLNTAAPVATTTEDGFALIICPRAKALPRENILDFPRLLKHLSISKASFRSIVTRLSFHRALVVLLDRGAPIISRIKCNINSTECKVYTLRLDHGLEHQTAMTITHFPKPAASNAQQSPHGSKTNALILGYDDVDVEELVLPLMSCKESIFAPFTLIKAFLHVERKRRFKEVNNKIAKFQSILQNYGRLPVGEEEKDQDNSGDNAQDPKNLIGLYISVCTLKNQLTAWKTQIASFQAHASDFAVPVGEQPDIDPEEYLQRLVDEYEVKINKCDLVLQGASLAFQMETAHLSRLDAQNALRDGKQMKAIALLTMFFLPGTFIAALMAVPEFETMKAVSGLPEWSWYLVLFLPLTAVVLAAYFLWTNYYKSKDQKALAHIV